MRLTLSIAAITALLTTPFLTTAHAETVEKVVDARRAYYTLFGSNIRPMRAMVKGETAYNASTAQKHARNFGVIARYDATPHFAPGTWKSDLPGKTRALAKIAEDPAGFAKANETFFAAVDNLQTVAGAGVDELKGALGELGKSCKGCHETYRAKDF